jgi:hypothetical protein
MSFLARTAVALVLALLMVGGVCGGGLGTAAAAPVGLPATAPREGLPCLPVVGCDPAGSLVGDGAKVAAQAVFDAMGSWVATGASLLLGKVGEVMTRTTAVHLDAKWFGQQFGVMRTLAGFVILPMLLAAAISAIVHQDPQRLVRAVLVHLPLAVLGTAVAIELVDRAVQLTDLLSNQVAASLGRDPRVALGGVTRAIDILAVPGGATGGFVFTIGALLLALGALLVWLELLVRSSAIYVAVLFLPLVLSGLVWPATARWARRLVELLTALILSKFVIVAVISLAAGALTTGDGLNDVLAGAALLLLAAFAPFVILRLVPVVEAGMIGHLEGMSRRPVAATTSAASHVAGLALGGSRGDGFSPEPTGLASGQRLAQATGTPLPDPPNPADHDSAPTPSSPGSPGGTETNCQPSDGGGMPALVAQGTGIQRPAPSQERRQHDA